MVYKLTLTDDIPFGKYINEMVEDVITKDPTYFRWAIENDVVELDDEAYIFYENEIDNWEFENNDLLPDV